MSFVDFFVSAFNAHTLHRVGCGTDASRIDETDKGVAQYDGFFHSVARGAVNVADQSTLFANQGIEQGGFSGIRFTHDGYRETTLQGIA